MGYIGDSYRRVDWTGKVSGRTRFLPDLGVEGMLHAALVYSSVPYAKIIRTAIGPASRVAGFRAAFFAGDIPGENQVGVIVEDQPLLAAEVVRYVGDAVGVVVADSDTAAHRAAALVEVEYENFNPVFSIPASKAARDNSLHESNIACEHRVLRGDPEGSLKQADQIIEADFQTPGQEHYYLESQGCIAVPEGDGSLKILGSVQCPFYVQKAVARVLNFPFNRIRVIQTPLGGGFGGKEDIPSEVCARAALAAWRLQRPVKMVYQRQEDVQTTSKRHPFRMHYKVGLTSDGKLVAADIRLEEDAGAYATLSSVVSYRAAMQAMGPYVIPNIRVHSVAYYTNLPPAGAFRGFGSPQTTFGHERMMDIIAERLGLDPIEFRLQNILRVGSRTQTGQRLTASVGVEETILKTRQVSRWEKERAAEYPPGRYRYGIGVATCHYGNGLGAAGWSLDGVGVRIQIHRDGSVSVAFGLVEMGQGALTVITQMTAAALGISAERISVLPTDTSQVPDSGPSVASRNVIMTGNAIRVAADKLIPLFKAAAAQLLESDPGNIDVRADEARDITSGNKVSFSQLAEYLFAHNYPLDAVGWWHVPPLDYDPERGLGEAYFTYSFATQIAKVRVDTLTGLVRVEKVWAGHDIGKAINPAGLEGQVEGGVAQGIGWALSEDLQHQEGRILTANLTTYLLPTARDIPPVETIIVEDPDPQGPWGAKGVGEPAIIPTAAAIANAVSHAVGIPLNEIPLTPEKVLSALAAAPSPRGFKA